MNPADIASAFGLLVGAVLAYDKAFTFMRGGGYIRAVFFAWASLVSMTSALLLVFG